MYVLSENETTTYIQLYLHFMICSFKKKKKKKHGNISDSLPRHNVSEDHEQN